MDDLLDAVATAPVPRDDGGPAPVAPHPSEVSFEDDDDPEVLNVAPEDDEDADLDDKEM